MLQENFNRIQLIAMQQIIIKFIKVSDSFKYLVKKVKRSNNSYVISSAVKYILIFCN